MTNDLLFPKTLPGVETIIKDNGIMEEFQMAWDDSFPTHNDCAVQGGFIYAEIEDREIVGLYVERAPSGPRFSQNGNDRDYPVVDLNSPPGGKRGMTSILLATFRTHPVQNGIQLPSREDAVDAYYRELPGIVIGREGLYRHDITFYALSRYDYTNPEGYPPNKDARQPGKLPNGKRTMGRENWRPERAPQQSD